MTMHVCTCMSMSISMHVQACPCMSMSMSVSVSVSISMSMSMYVSVSISVSMSMSMSMYVSTSMSIYDKTTAVFSLVQYHTMCHHATCPCAPFSIESLQDSHPSSIERCATMLPSSLRPTSPPLVVHYRSRRRSNPKVEQHFLDVLQTKPSGISWNSENVSCISRTLFP